MQNVVNNTLQIVAFNIYYIRKGGVCVKKAANKKRKMNRSRMDIIRVCALALIVGSFLYTLVTQQIDLVNIRRQTAQCREEISKKQELYEMYKEKAESNSTDEFYEEKARDEGYVRSDETVFVVGN